MWSALASWVDTATTDWTLSVQKKVKCKKNLFNFLAFLRRFVQTFLRWLNVIFSKHDLPAAEDITTVFSDGTLLCILLEILTGRELSFANQPSLTEKYHINWLFYSNPFCRAKIRNVELSLALMKKEGIDISGVVAKGIWFTSYRNFLLSLRCGGRRHNNYSESDLEVNSKLPLQLICGIGEHNANET